MGSRILGLSWLKALSKTGHQLIFCERCFDVSSVRLSVMLIIRVKTVREISRWRYETRVSHFRITLFTTLKLYHKSRSIRRAKVALRTVHGLPIELSYWCQLIAHHGSHQKLSIDTIVDPAQQISSSPKFEAHQILNCS